MIIKHKIGHIHTHIHMKIDMFHIELINFPFAQRVTEFLISPWHRLLVTIVLEFTSQNICLNGIKKSPTHNSES